MIENNDVTTSRIGTSIKVTSVEYEFATAHLSNFYRRKQSKMHDCSNARTTIFSTISLVDRPISFGAQTIRGKNYETAVIICFYSVIAAILLFSERLQGQRDSALDKEK